MHHYRLLTSHNYDHFYVRFNNKKSYIDLCDILTRIQSVPYKVNKQMLEFLMNNKEKLEEAGLLMPSFLAKVDPARVRDEIGYLLSTEESQDSELTFRGIARLVFKRMQEARYEQFLLKLAHGYKDHNIYFPAFIEAGFLEQVSLTSMKGI